MLRLRLALLALRTVLPPAFSWSKTNVSGEWLRAFVLCQRRRRDCLRWGTRTVFAPATAAAVEDTCKAEGGRLLPQTILHPFDGDAVERMGHPSVVYWVAELAARSWAARARTRSSSCGSPAMERRIGAMAPTSRARPSFTASVNWIISASSPRWSKR